MDLLFTGSKKMIVIIVLNGIQEDKKIKQLQSMDEKDGILNQSFLSQGLPYSPTRTIFSKEPTKR